MNIAEQAYQDGQEYRKANVYAFRRCFVFWYNVPIIRQEEV